MDYSADIEKLSEITSITILCRRLAKVASTSLVAHEAVPIVIAVFNRDTYGVTIASHGVATLEEAYVTHWYDSHVSDIEAARGDLAEAPEDWFCTNLVLDGESDPRLVITVFVSRPYTVQLKEKAELFRQAVVASEMARSRSLEKDGKRWSLLVSTTATDVSTNLGRIPGEPSRIALQKTGNQAEEFQTQANGTFAATGPLGERRNEQAALSGDAPGSPLFDSSPEAIDAFMEHGK